MNTLQTILLLAFGLTIVLEAPSTAEPAATPKIVGQWTFTYKGEKRPFQFNDNNTFSGRYPISGKACTGTWKLDGAKVILIRDGKPGEFGSITFKMSDEAEYIGEGFRMAGHRAKL